MSCRVAEEHGQYRCEHLQHVVDVNWEEVETLWATPHFHYAYRPDHQSCPVKFSVLRCLHPVSWAIVGASSSNFMKSGRLVGSRYNVNNTDIRCRPSFSNLSSISYVNEAVPDSLQADIPTPPSSSRDGVFQKNIVQVVIFALRLNNTHRKVFSTKKRIWRVIQKVNNICTRSLLLDDLLRINPHILNHILNMKNSVPICSCI